MCVYTYIHILKYMYLYVSLNLENNHELGYNFLAGGYSTALQWYIWISQGH